MSIIICLDWFISDDLKKTIFCGVWAWTGGLRYAKDVFYYCTISHPDYLYLIYIILHGLLSHKDPPLGFCFQRGKELEQPSQIMLIGETKSFHIDHIVKWISK